MCLTCRIFLAFSLTMSAGLRAKSGVSAASTALRAGSLGQSKYFWKRLNTASVTGIGGSARVRDGEPKAALLGTGSAGISRSIFCWTGKTQDISTERSELATSIRVHWCRSACRSRSASREGRATSAPESRSRREPWRRQLRKENTVRTSAVAAKVARLTLALLVVGDLGQQVAVVGGEQLLDLRHGRHLPEREMSQSV
jgi:hypothetical protein